MLVIVGRCGGRLGSTGPGQLDGFAKRGEAGDQVPQSVGQVLERAAAWQLAAAAIAGGDYQLVVLDEITYPMNWGWIDGQAVLETIRTRPPQVNIVATGRDAPGALIEVADTVTEMVKVRHAYDSGIKARRGIDF